MQGAKEKVQDMVSTAKAKVKESEAKVEEKMEKAAARSEVQKEIAHQRAKAKIAEAKMEMHVEKAQHREESMMRHPHLQHGVAGVQPVHPRQHDVGVQPVHQGLGPTPASAFPAYPAPGVHPVTKK